MIISVNKEKDMTSRDVVNILNKKFNTKKVGHTGTLDPLASGVLICLLGRDTKLVDIITSKYKEYIATFKLGFLTDTLDITGNIISKKEFDVDEDKIKKVMNSFLGDSIQEVPKYSAVKVNGKKLYEYAREGIDVKLPKKSINIKEIELLEFSDDTVKFRVVVSKGTYIRSLIRDISLKLNTYGTMSDLVRTKQGIFNIEDSNSISDILNDKYTVIDYDYLFSDIKKISIDDTDLKKVINGSKMNIDLLDEKIIFTYNNRFIALYKKDNDSYRLEFLFDNNTLI